MPEVRRARAAARRRHQPCRAVLQRRGGARLHEVHEPDPRARTRARVRPGSAGRRLRYLAESRRGAPAHVRARSVHAQPVHARRHGREQLLRHALAARRQDRGQHRGTAHPALRRHAAHGRTDQRRGARRDHQGRAGVAATSIRGSRASGIGMPRSFGSDIPDIPRRVSGYNLDQLLPENGFNVARALVGSEGTCAIVLEAKMRLIPSPQHRSLVGLGYADVFAAADQVPGDPRVPADRPRRVRRRHDRRAASARARRTSS